MLHLITPLEGELHDFTETKLKNIDELEFIYFTIIVLAQIREFL